MNTNERQVALERRLEDMERRLAYQMHLIVVQGRVLTHFVERDKHLMATRLLG